MNLRHRSASPADLEAAYDVLAPSYGDCALRERFGEAWEALFRSGAGRAAMVEDITDPAAPRPLGYGGRAFVSADFAQELRERRHGPTAGSAVLRRALEGGEGVLDLSGVRAAQEGAGLHLVLMHCAFVGQPPGGFSAEGLEALNAIFFVHHRGFRLREILKDVFSEEERRWFCGSGFSLRIGEEEPSVERPALISVTREDAEANPGCRYGAAFTFHPQRLALRTPYRQVIEAALDGLFDEEFADLHAISISAVKKRWTAIYDHVDLVLPGLLPPSDPFAGKARGAERRRHLLAYVREHPEELVPLVD